jgi:hypothetical protein
MADIINFPRFEDPDDLAAAEVKLSRLLGITLAEVRAMTPEQLMDGTARTACKVLAMTSVTAHIDDLLDYGPEEQTDRATAALHRFHERYALWPIHGGERDLFGFGKAPIRFAHFDEDNKVTEEYFLLSEVAEALAIPLPRAHEWARRDQDDAIRAQRERDEKTGALGWDCMNDVIDMELSFIVDDPDAKPDHDGRRWASVSDWLISSDRLLALMTISPWQKEFMDNAMPLFGHAMRHAIGDKLGNIRAVDIEGNPLEADGFDLFSTDGLTVEEAAEQARRGPALGGE